MVLKEQKSVLVIKWFLMLRTLDCVQLDQCHSENQQILTNFTHPNPNQEVKIILPSHESFEALKM